MGYFEQINRKAFAPLIHVPEPGHFDREKQECPFSFKLSGTLVIIGSAPCVYDDLKAIAEIRQSCHLMAINEAVLIRPVHHVVSCHIEKIEKFYWMHVERWGNSADAPYPHTQEKKHSCDRMNNAFYWKLTSGAGSAGFAIKIGLTMGYDEIILAGCPLDGSHGYFNNETTAKCTPSDPRLGYTKNPALLEGWQRGLRILAEDPAIGPDVFSMSGYTREIFGYPDGEPT